MLKTTETTQRFPRSSVKVLPHRPCEIAGDRGTSSFILEGCYLEQEQLQRAHGQTVMEFRIIIKCYFVMWKWLVLKDSSSDMWASDHFALVSETIRPSNVKLAKRGMVWSLWWSLCITTVGLGACTETDQKNLLEISMTFTLGASGHVQPPACSSCQFSSVRRAEQKNIVAVCRSSNFPSGLSSSLRLLSVSFPSSGLFFQKKGRLKLLFTFPSEHRLLPHPIPCKERTHPLPSRGPSFVFSRLGSLS